MASSTSLIEMEEKDYNKIMTIPNESVKSLYSKIHSVRITRDSDDKYYLQIILNNDKTRYVSLSDPAYDIKIRLVELEISPEDIQTCYQLIHGHFINLAKSFE